MTNERERFLLEELIAAWELISSDRWHVYRNSDSYQEEMKLWSEEADSKLLDFKIQLTNLG